MHSVLRSESSDDILSFLRFSTSIFSSSSLILFLLESISIKAFLRRESASSSSASESSMLSVEREISPFDLFYFPLDLELFIFSFFVDFKRNFFRVFQELEFLVFSRFRQSLHFVKMFSFSGKLVIHVIQSILASFSLESKM